MSTTKILYGLIALLVLTGAGFYIYGQKQTQAPTVDSANSNKVQPLPALPNHDVPLSSGTNAEGGSGSAPTNPITTPPNGSTDSESQGHYSDESTIDGNDIGVEAVIYNGKTFSPSSITVKAGDIIVFKNQSSSTILIRGANSATLAAYPGLDSEDISAGSNFEFKFTKAGTWKYQDKYSSAQGTIVVTK